MNNTIIEVETRRLHDARHNPLYGAFLDQIKQIEDLVLYHLYHDEEEIMCGWLAYLMWYYEWQAHGEDTVYPS